MTFRFGFLCSLAAFVASAGYCIVQMLQVIQVLVWPWDDILIYAFSFGIAWPFMLAMLALHYATREDRKIWSGAALLFAVMYAVYVSIMYAVQLGTAIPLALHGTPNPLFDNSRYSLFWTIDGMGYICMGLSTLFGAAAFEPGSWIRRFFLANGMLTAVIAVIYFWPVFSIPLLLFGSPWMITEPGSIVLLAAWFAMRRPQ